MITKPLIEVLRGRVVSPPSVWLMRQAGRYLPEYRAVRTGQTDFIRFCLNPEAAAEVTLQPIRRFGLDAAIVFADILLIPYGLGQKVWFEQGEGPRLEPLTPEVQARFDVDRSREVLRPVSETIRKVRAELPGSVALIGFAGSPWTVATYMIEGGGSKDRFAARALAWSDPQRLDALLDTLVEASARYLADQAEAGADVLKVFDSWADSLPDPLFDRVVITPTQKIVMRLRELGVSQPVIGFPRGAGPQILRYGEQTGVDALALDHGMASTWAATSLPSSLPVQGQLDPAVLHAGGEALDREVDRLMGIWSGRPWIFNLGHGIHLTTTPEHVTRLLDRIRSWQR